MAILWYYLLLAIGLNVVLFVVAYYLRTDALTDAGYALTFVMLATLSYMHDPMHWSHVVILVCVVAWAVRLASFLVVRVIAKGGDRRFDGVREVWWRFLSFWIYQAIVAWVVMLSAMLFLVSSELHISLIGVGVWLLGLVWEASADYQKFRFRQDPANKDDFITTGLWRYSRHPNYFGEILCWLGIYLAVVPSLDGWGFLVGLASPVMISMMLIYVSGLPQVEEYADRRWGGQKKYEHYKASTPVLVPKLFR